jgi:hypothetical protein
MKRSITWERVLWPIDSTDPRRSRDWVSTCGTYRIWIQGRPRDGGIEYGAEVVGHKPWLGDLFTLTEAKQACEEHKHGIRRPARISYGLGRTS